MEGGENQEIVDSFKLSRAISLLELRMTIGEGVVFQLGRLQKLQVKNTNEINVFYVYTFCYSCDTNI